MSEEEMKKMLEELAESRKSQNIKPIKTSNFIVNMDFASLYPRMSNFYYTEKETRKIIIIGKIKKIFDL